MLGNGGAKLDDLAKSFSSTSVGSVGVQVSTLSDLVKLNAAQTAMLQSSRLQIPVAFTAEMLHSGGHPGCTVFPMPAGQGASWNTTLVRLIAESNALQARASGTVHGLAPVLNVATDPRFGRSAECFGEDPLLVANMGVAAVQGLQGFDGLGGPNAYFGSRSKSPLATEILPENTDGWDGAPLQCSLGAAACCYLPFMLTRARCTPDDVIAFLRPGDPRNVASKALWGLRLWRCGRVQRRHLRAVAVRALLLPVAAVRDGGWPGGDGVAQLDQLRAGARVAPLDDRGAAEPAGVRGGVHRSRLAQRAGAGHLSARC